MPAAPHVQFACGECQRNFPSNKALEQHARVIHGARTPIKQFVDASGICPVCTCNFRTRMRVISHLGDPRRPKCRDVILAGQLPAVSAAAREALDALDREALKAARHAGHSHALAVASAVRADGKRIGHVQM